MFIGMIIIYAAAIIGMSASKSRCWKFNSQIHLLMGFYMWGLWELTEIWALDLGMTMETHHGIGDFLGCHGNLS